MIKDKIEAVGTMHIAYAIVYDDSIMYIQWMETYRDIWQLLLRMNWGLSLSIADIALLQSGFVWFMFPSSKLIPCWI